MSLNLINFVSGFVCWVLFIKKSYNVYFVTILYKRLTTHRFWHVWHMSPTMIKMFKPHSKHEFKKTSYSSYAAAATIFLSMYHLTPTCTTNYSFGSIKMQCRKPLVNFRITFKTSRRNTLNQWYSDCWVILKSERIAWDWYLCINFCSTPMQNCYI